MYKSYLKDYPSLVTWIDNYIHSIASKYHLWSYKDELASEVLYLIAKAEKTYNDKGNLQNWIKITITNGLNKYAKKEFKYYHNGEVDEFNSNTPEKLVDNLTYEVCEKFIDTFNSLSFLEKAVIYLYYYELKTEKDISTELNDLSVKKINSILKCYKDALRGSDEIRL